MSGITSTQDTASLPSIGWMSEDLDNDLRRSSPVQCPDAYNGVYNTSPARQRLLYYTDLQDETSSLSWVGGGGSRTWRRVRWVLGITLCLLCATTRSLTTLYATTNVHPNIPPVGPYTKAAIGHAGVAWLSGCVVLIGRGSVRIHSSRHFFLLVGAVTFLGVAELLGAHAATFTPFNTLEGLVATWRLAGSVCFMRLLHRSRLTAGRLLALALCSVGCLLVSQPEWFMLSSSESVMYNSTTYSYRDNWVGQNYSSLLNTTWAEENYSTSNYNTTTNHHSPDVSRGRHTTPSNGILGEQLEITPAVPLHMTNGNPKKNVQVHPNSSIGSHSTLRTVQFSASALNQLEEESYNADYLIGCVICSVAGLFAGAWFTVAYVTSDLPVFTLFFWTSLICAITSSAMALHNELLVFPNSQPEGPILLLTESFGAALVLYGATAGARFTNPMVAAVLLTLPLVVNMGTSYLLPDSRVGMQGAVAALEGSVWLGVSGGIVLVCGVVYSLVLETWRRHCSPRRRLLSDHYRKLNMGLGESMNSRVSRMTQA